MIEQLVLYAAPASRHSDPDTSRRAAERVSKGSKELEAAIAAVVAQHTDALVAEQIAQHIAATSDRWTIPSIVTAVTRARRRGLIIPAGTGTTSRGSSATAYRVPR